MADLANVRFVDAHPKRNSRHHNPLSGDEPILRGFSFLSRDSSMVHARLDTLILEGVDDLFGVGMSSSVHDGTASTARLKEGDKEGDFRGKVEGRLDEKREVGPVVAGTEDPRGDVNVEAVIGGADVFDDRGGGSLEGEGRLASLKRKDESLRGAYGGEAEDALGCDLLRETGNFEVLRTERGTPLGYTVTLATEEERLAPSSSAKRQHNHTQQPAATPLDPS